MSWGKFELFWHNFLLIYFMNEFQISTMTMKFDVGFGKIFCKKPAVIWYENLISSVYYIFMYFSKTYISITYL